MSDLLGCLEVVLQNRLLEIRMADKPARVDIDHHERLGAVDDDMTAGWKPDFAIERLAELILHMEPLEQRKRVRIPLDTLDEIGIGVLEVGDHHVVHSGIPDEEPLEVPREVLADHANHQRWLLIDEAGGTTVGN